MWGILSPPYHIRKRQNAPEKCDPLSTTICTVHPCSILVDPFEELIFISDRKKQNKTVNPSFTVPLIWSTFTVSAPRDQIRNFPWQRLKEGSIGATLMNLNCRKGKLLPANRLFHHLASESRSLRLFYKKFLFFSVFVTVIKCLKVTRIDLQRCYLIIFVFA